MLLRAVHDVKDGDTILVHAAAGGVGLILCQWANALGATVIGTVSTEEKAELARAHGCDHPILYTKQDFVAEVAKITAGQKVPVVYDSVGKTTFMQSLDCLRPRGLMVSFGYASGPVDPISPLVLSQKGSLFLTRPTLFHYIASRAELEQSARELFDIVRSGKVKIEVKQRFALRDAAEAHRALEARKTSGSTIFEV
jgi:NADPH2:quinone reductase